MPLITIVIPTRDRPSFLLETLRFALHQRDVELEVIVVDDGSAAPASKAVSGLGNGQIAVIRNETAAGVGAARNRGMDAAAGDWVAFLDDDDLWAPNKLALQLAAARDNECDWAFAGAVAIDERRGIIAGSPPPLPEEAAALMPYRNMVPAGASNVIARKALLSEVGPFDDTLRHMADWDLWIRLARQGPPAVVTEPLVAYRIHPGNASADIAEIPRELAVLDRRYAYFRGGRPCDRAYVYRWIAWNALRAGRRWTATAAYGRAAKAGDVLSVLRAAAGLVRPSLARGRLDRHIPDPDWAASARDWIGPEAGP